MRFLACLSAYLPMAGGFAVSVILYVPLTLWFMDRRCGFGHPAASPPGVQSLVASCRTGPYFYQLCLSFKCCSPAVVSLGSAGPLRGHFVLEGLQPFFRLSQFA